MAYKNIAAFDNLRVVDFGSINSTYTAVGPALPSQAVAFAVKNNTNAIIYVSTDGVNDKLGFPVQSYDAWDVRTNAPGITDYLLPAGTSFSIKYVGSAPTSGSVYIETLVVQQ